MKEMDFPRGFFPMNEKIMDLLDPLFFPPMVRHHQYPPKEYYSTVS
jgi:hypothetical protein